jgi:hypothetical protein
MPLCLGKEEDIVPVLKGIKPVPEDIHPRRRAILSELLSERGIEHEVGA